MSITKNSLVWFRDSKNVTVALTASISLLGLSACSAPVENVVNSDGTVNQPAITAGTESVAPSASPDPDAIYSQETDGYKEWDGTSGIAPGVYVADPSGKADAKPEDLFGHSAYFKDGAWYVFDPSQGLPQYVKDVYLAPTSTPNPSGSDENKTNRIATHDLEICYVSLGDSVGRDGGKTYYAFGVEWVGQGGQSPDGIANVVIDGREVGDLNRYSTAEEAFNVMKATLETRGNCRNSEIPISYAWSPSSSASS